MSGDGDARPSLDQHYAYCESHVKEGDRTRWLASLFAPADARPALHALGAFALDVRSVRNRVHEPLAGELRLQWWTDAIEGEARGDVRGHPVAAALLDTIRRHHLPRAALTGFLDAARDDLYDEPLATLDDFDDRADRIEGASIVLAMQCLAGAVAEPSRSAALHAGRVMAVGEAFRALAQPVTRPQVLVPLDVLRDAGIGTAELMVRRNTPAIGAALAALRTHGEREIAALRALRSAIAPDASSALLMASLVPPRLSRTATRGFDPFAAKLDLPQWRSQWLLWRAAGRNGVL